jgi:riboflavin synthase
MFSGIIEETGLVKDIIADKTNLNFIIRASFSQQLKVDQSIAHNGVCLTVVELLQDNSYKVTAIKETIDKTNLGLLKKGDLVNLERCLTLNALIDGHLVQGHVDQTGVCTSIEDENGSWVFTFKYDSNKGNITVEKGSVCINGVSLTVVNSNEDNFSVAIIPYTFEHTNFKSLKVGNSVNIEFDIIGKYVAKYMSLSNIKK